MAIVVFVSVLAALVSAKPGLAAKDRPHISNVSVYVLGGHIVSDLRSDRLFSSEIVGTVQSGLPAVVELLFSLTSRENETVKRGVYSYELQYDVWDDIYTIVGLDSTTSFRTFAKMGGAIERLRRVRIVPLKGVDPAAEYSVHFSIAVHPLRGTEKSRIEGWVGETVRGQQGETWHEQVLNLNDLVRRFFSREDEPSNRSDWYRTEFFSPRSLPVADAGNKEPRDAGDPGANSAKKAKKE